jgi:WD40 repeat protein
VAFDKRGETLATGSGDLYTRFGHARHGTVRLWDLTREDPTVACTELAGHTGSITSIALSNDGRWIATSDAGIEGQSSGRARLWDLKTEDRKKSGTVLRAHDDQLIAHVAISPNSRWLITVGVDNVPLMLWDLHTSDPALSGVALVADRQPAELVAESLLFTPDSRAIQVIGINGVRSWLLDIDELVTLAQETAGRELTVEERRRYLLPPQR